MLDEWLSITADIISVATFVVVFIFGRSMVRHHKDAVRHRNGGTMEPHNGDWTPAPEPEPDTKRQTHEPMRDRPYFERAGRESIPAVRKDDEDDT